MLKDSSIDKDSFKIGLLIVVLVMLLVNNFFNLKDSDKIDYIKNEIKEVKTELNSVRQENKKLQDRIEYFNSEINSIDKGIDINNKKIQNLKIYEKNAKNNNKNMTFSIVYPKFFDTPVAVRPELKLEVIAKEETLLDTKNERIISFLRFAQKKIDDHTTFKCLAIEEILAGKISALIWKYQKKESQGNNIRHLYDTASIYAQKQIDLSVLKKIIFYIIFYYICTIQKEPPAPADGSKIKTKNLRFLK
jgi:hypothetical protein